MTELEKIQQLHQRMLSEPLEKLSDASYLEFRLLPELGLNDRHMNQYPRELHAYCGIGIDSWQYPNQFSRYLQFLGQQGIQNYIEIGCHKGGTFIITVEYLSRFNSVDRCVAVDNWPRSIMHEYQQFRSGVEYITESSQSDRFRDVIASRVWDLVLIDGDHSYPGVCADFELVRDHAKYIAFHDIRNILCPGTQQIWQDIKKQYRPNQLHEWVDQYDDVLLRMRGSIMGIGLLHNV